MLNQRKPHKRYIFYRYYAVIAWLAFMIWLIFWILSFATNREPTVFLFVLGFGILFPCFLIAIFMLQNIFPFPFEYGILGDLERTPFPNEEPLTEVTSTWGQFGVFRATMPFFSWYIFPSGLGISILGFGKAFIPIEQITSLNQTSNLIIWQSPYVVMHNSKEINGPIYLPDKYLYDTLKELCNKKSAVQNELYKI